MNKLMVKFVFLVIGLGSCATPPTPLPPTLIPPTLTPTLPPVCQSLESQEVPSNLSEREVVSEMIAQMNAGDVAGAMAYFAEDARVYIIGVPPIGFEENRGKEAICRTLADFVNDNLEWEITILSAFNSPKGVLITSKSNIWLDFYRQLDVAPNKFFENIFIEDGKISEYSLTLNEESLAKLKSVLSEDLLMRSESAADTSSTTPGTEFNIVFSDNTCSYDGPAVWKSDSIDINGEVKDDQEYSLLFISVDEGKDFFDLAIASSGHKPYWARYTAFDFGPGENKTVQHTVGGERMYLMCVVEKGTTIPIGLFGPFETKP